MFGWQSGRAGRAKGAGQMVQGLGGWVLLNYSAGITADGKFSYLSPFFASGGSGAEAPGSSFA